MCYKKFLRSNVLVFFLNSLILSGCGPGQLFGPTITPTPTHTQILPTSTSTPVPPTVTLTSTLRPIDTPIPPTETGAVELFCVYYVNAHGNSTAKQYLDTGIDLIKGEHLVIGATGTACFDGTNMDNCNGPDGHPSFDNTDLVGKIGNGEMFHIGTSFEKVVDIETGRLYLAFNDSDFANNSGYFKVTVTINNAFAGECVP